MLSPRRALLALLLAVGLGAFAAGTRSPDPPRTADGNEREQLAALGYADWVPAASLLDFSRADVVLHRPERTAGGLNLYNSRPRAAAQLVDMQGRVVHEWIDPRAPEEGWHHVEMTAAGELFAIVERESLVKLDRDSRLLWEARIPAHHDVAFDSEGRVYTLTTRRAFLDDGGLRFPADLDFVAVLSAEGDLLREHPLHEILRAAAPPGALRARYEALDRDRTSLDVHHANSIQILDRDVPGFGRKGDALLSVREMDLVAVVRLSDGTLSWSWGPGVIEAQHHATLLANGNLLLFDNGRERSWSRVLELDPASREIVWSWHGRERGDLRTRTRGSVQRLADGNTLVTDSNRGRAIEVTSGGEVVWEFFNPDRKLLGLRRAPIYRVTRQDPSWLPPPSG